MWHRVATSGSVSTTQGLDFATGLARRFAIRISCVVSEFTPEDARSMWSTAL